MHLSTLISEALQRRHSKVAERSLKFSLFDSLILGKHCIRGAVHKVYHETRNKIRKGGFQKKNILAG